MEIQEILRHVDHTLLSQTATWEEIRTLCDDAIAYGTASVCIPPSYVKQAKAYVKERMAVCTVIGFPNGYNTTAAKVFETAEAGVRPDHAGNPIRQRGGRQPDIEGDHRDLLPGRRGEDTDVPGRD